MDNNRAPLSIAYVTKVPSKGNQRIQKRPRRAISGYKSAFERQSVHTNAPSKGSQYTALQQRFYSKTCVHLNNLLAASTGRLQAVDYLVAGNTVQMTNPNVCSKATTQKSTQKSQYKNKIVNPEQEPILTPPIPSISSAFMAGLYFFVAMIGYSWDRRSAPQIYFFPVLTSLSTDIRTSTSKERAISTGNARRDFSLNPN